MPRVPIQYSEGEIYHVFNRGVEKRDVFMDNKDYLRFVNGLYVFNDENYVEPSNIRLMSRKPREAQEECLGVRPLNIGGVGKKSEKPKARSKLVEILAYCLVPNHYHLLLRQLVEKGVSRFMQKLGTGYVSAFNLKYNRVGPLFQGRFKAVHIKNNRQMLWIPHYIHFNALDLMFRGQTPKHGGVHTVHTERRNAMEFLEGYKWSSFPDYVFTKESGKQNFPSIIDRPFILDMYGDEMAYRKDAWEWLSHPQELLRFKEAKKIIKETENKWF